MLFRSARKASSSLLTPVSKTPAVEGALPCESFAFSLEQGGDEEERNAEVSVRGLASAVLKDLR